MERRRWPWFGAAAALVVLACGSKGATGTASGGETAVSDVGAPCIPAEELSPTFAGFDEQEVSTDTKNPDCVGVCLVDHFRGRTTCPYGQACTVPGSSAAVTAQVHAQCVDRAAAKVVTCSCRCANADGHTDDGASYCACPSGFTCAQLVTPIGQGDALSGAYCIAQGTAYDRTNACAATCDPTSAPCAASDAGVPAGGDAATTSFVTIVKLQDGLCLPQALPANANGAPACNVYFVLTDGDTCAAHSGINAVDPQISARIRGAAGAPDASVRAVCLLAQLAAPCTSAPVAGWCYESGATAPSGCAQSLGVSPTGSPPAGATAVLACD
jgi:hypothetical protein